DGHPAGVGGRGGGAAPRRQRHRRGDRGRGGAGPQRAAVERDRRRALALLRRGDEGCDEFRRARNHAGGGRREPVSRRDGHAARLPHGGVQRAVCRRAGDGRALGAPSNRYGPIPL
ncbi:MAG: Gamma-glutamyltranspeptidase @ Glutathione hydrolase, partial [uncultured Acetobacteraceae bacterium]